MFPSPSSHQGVSEERSFLWNQTSRCHTCHCARRIPTVLRWHNVPPKTTLLSFQPSEQRVTSCSRRKQLRWHTELHIPAQPRKGLCHTADTFSSEPQCPVQALLSPSLSWYSNQSTQLKAWEDIKCTELCQKPSQKWQLLRQSDSSLKSLNGKAGLDGIPRQIQGVPSGSHTVHHYQPGCQVLKMHKLWAEHSPNQPTMSFRSPADPKKEFCFSAHLDALPGNAFSTNVTPALCHPAEAASRKKHSRKPGSTVTFNHSELALFEVKHTWHKKTNPGNFLLVQHCL